MRTTTGTRRDATSRRIRVGGHVTHYLDAGEGPPLLLLHGGEFGAGAEVTWDTCMSQLARRRRVIALDLLGFGRSDKVRDMVDQRRATVSQVRDVLEALCLEHVDVVGTSFSARLLVDVLSQEQPAWSVGAAVVVGLGLKPPSRDVRAVLASFDGSEETMRATLRLLFHGPETAEDPEVLRRRMDLALLPGAWQFGRAAGIGSPTGAERPVRPPAPPYHAIRRPVLLVIGQHDAIVPQEDAAALRDQIPGSRLEVVRDAGHYPQIERPDATVEIIESFLDTHATAAEVRT